MNVCIFCGSSSGRRPEYAEAARALAKACAAMDVGIVYGGASVGVMGVLADAALAAGGRVVGVIPRALMEREIAHAGLTELHVVAGMHERKARMAALADAFVALPGGAGTLEELFEAWTWGQLGIHTKPVALLDVDGFHLRLLAMLDHMVAEGFLRAEYRDALIVERDPLALLARLRSDRPPESRWQRPDGSAERAGDPADVTVDAIAWVEIADGRLLLVRNRGRDAFYLPGGEREPGESDGQALARELREELGVALLPSSLRPFGVFAVPRENADARGVRMACYTARHTGVPVASAEVEEIVWATVADRDRAAPAAQLVLDEAARRGLLR